MRQDWDQRINFWHEYTTTGGKLKSPLGGWINPTHRIWHWYYDKNREALYHINGPTIRLFVRATRWRCARSTTTFELKQTTSTTKIIPKGVPTLVITMSESRVNKHHKGPLLISKADAPVSFWTFISSWGGNRMWREISNGNKPKDDMQWVADGMMAGTLIWTTDRSYDRKKAVDLSGVGWIIFCKATGKRLTGSFWERSITASSFRAEMLGLCALHLLARAISEYYTLGRWTATMCCNNKRALTLSSHHNGRIHPSAK